MILDQVPPIETLLCPFYELGVFTEHCVRTELSAVLLPVQIDKLRTTGYIALYVFKYRFSQG